MGVNDSDWKCQIRDTQAYKLKTQNIGAITGQDGLEVEQLILVCYVVDHHCTKLGFFLKNI